MIMTYINIKYCLQLLFRLSGMHSIVEFWGDINFAVFQSNFPSTRLNPQFFAIPICKALQDKIARFQKSAIPGADPGNI